MTVYLLKKSRLFDNQAAFFFFFFPDVTKGEGAFNHH